MINKDKIVDGVVFKDEDDPEETVVFNFHTWVEMLKAIIVKYANKKEDEAELMVLSSSLVCKPIDSYLAVCLRSHELEYHWAMLIAYGEQFWLKGVSSKQPDDYLILDESYRKDHNLAEESFVFND
ncbi:uncharacterized protein KLLA0_E04599g [Kluyveromyces lactis]|uniref:KLLA0E04599p n=1 Tax=Kluyveromyces lactis (strain ATCC 8585 / CBS 2359 / DSM 70799 / NBRC 1267 / NRRL Y-1140 / WM37) TaxID=284590 RepID=Q6CPI6_KLULA|nr:uncharacterized protein KLLA0_E04599g [Kluyveromyces lactis]CAG99240.1 KLLA0E04599p [Kluyveromyces lactis]|eukprot:XP_454153.1 uncharacterized protein KLLA0_E04599g [Kluyveromyces lactis]